MIEVEKKFKLTNVQRESLIKDATFVSEKIIIDTYFDTADYKLTTKDIWLRQRDDSFELKVAVHFGYDRPADQYDEITDQEPIRKKLNILQDTGDLVKDLASHGILPFVTCQTTRRKYTTSLFTLDMDSVAYDDGSTYTLAEIECMVQEQTDVSQAIERIYAFAKTHGCTLEPIRGKIVEYLLRHRPEHFKALVNAGVIKE